MDAIYTTKSGNGPADADGKYRYALSMRRRSGETFEDAWERAKRAVSRIDGATLERLRF